MRRCVGFCLVVLILLSARPLFAQGFQIPEHAKAFATAPDIPFDSVANFLKMPPNIYLGESVGVALKEHGSLHAIDCRTPNVLYTGDLTNWRVQKLTLRPTPAQGTN